MWLCFTDTHTARFCRSNPNPPRNYSVRTVSLNKCLGGLYGLAEQWAWQSTDTQGCTTPLVIITYALYFLQRAFWVSHVRHPWRRGTSKAGQGVPGGHTWVWKCAGRKFWKFIKILLESGGRGVWLCQLLRHHTHTLNLDPSKTGNQICSWDYSSAVLCVAVRHIKRGENSDRSRPPVAVLDKELCNGLQQKSPHKQININMNRAATMTGEKIQA